VGALSYTRQLGWLALRVRGEFSSSDARLQDYQSSFLRAGLSLDALWPVYQQTGWRCCWGRPWVSPSCANTMSGTKQFRRTRLRCCCLGHVALYRSTWLVLSAQGGGEVFR